MAAPYAVTGDEHAALGWSDVRLPFEPRGDLRAYRDELRAALRRMRPRQGEGLIATYEAPGRDRPFADVENVALYNIGSGAYSHLTGGGLSCRRAASADARHHLKYRIGPLLDPDPEATRVLAWVEGPLGRSPHTAGDWWSTLRPYVRRNPEVVETHGGEFVVDVTLAGAWTGRQVAAVTKPMLDGLISALHSHDGGDAADLRPRLERLGRPEDVWQALCEPSGAVLGVLSLIRKHGPGIAWNPADHRCKAFRIRVEPGPAKGLSATIRS